MTFKILKVNVKKDWIERTKIRMKQSNLANNTPKSFGMYKKYVKREKFYNF